jgi:hypothetical protein
MPVLVSRDVPLAAEVLRDRGGAAQVREREADHAERCRRCAVPLSSSLFWSKSYPVATFVIEQRDVLVERLLEHVLLVRAAQPRLVERELVVLGAGADRRDGGVGLLGVEETLAHEEVFGAPELHLVEMARLRDTRRSAPRSRRSPPRCARARRMRAPSGRSPDRSARSRDTWRGSRRRARSPRADPPAPPRRADPAAARRTACWAPARSSLATRRSNSWSDSRWSRCACPARRAASACHRRARLGRRHLADLAVAEDPELLLEL